MTKITLTENQREIVSRLGDTTYTPEYLEEWLNRGDNVYINAPAALSAMGAKGFYRAVLAMEQAETAMAQSETAPNDAEPAKPDRPKTTRKSSSTK